MAALSRKFYEDIAARFRNLKPSGENTPQHVTWEAMVAETANAVTASGSTFNRQRFYEACGLVTPRPS